MRNGLLAAKTAVPLACFLAAFLSLTACAGAPARESPNAVRVAGSLSQEFPEGFLVGPGPILDLGRITIRYTAPQRSNRVTFARSTIVEDQPDGLSL
jgi:hypothetical protein